MLMLSYCLTRSSEHHDGSLRNILFPERVVAASLLVKEGGVARERELRERERERERGTEDVNARPCPKNIRLRIGRNLIAAD